MRFDLSDATGAILVWQVIARFEAKSESCSNIDSVPIQVNSVRCIYMPISYQIACARFLNLSSGQSSPPSLGRSAVERPIQCADPRLAARMERHLRYGVEQCSCLRNGCLGLLQALSYRPTKTTRRCINGFALRYRSHRSWVLWLVQTHR